MARGATRTTTDAALRALGKLGSIDAELGPTEDQIQAAIGHLVENFNSFRRRRLRQLVDNAATNEGAKIARSNTERSARSKTPRHWRPSDVRHHIDRVRRAAGDLSRALGELEADVIATHWLTGEEEAVAPFLYAAAAEGEKPSLGGPGALVVDPSWLKDSKEPDADATYRRRRRGALEFLRLRRAAFGFDLDRAVAGRAEHRRKEKGYYLADPAVLLAKDLAALQEAQVALDGAQDEETRDRAALDWARTYRRHALWAQPIDVYDVLLAPLRARVEAIGGMAAIVDGKLKRAPRDSGGCEISPLERETLGERFAFHCFALFDHVRVKARPRREWRDKSVRRAFFAFVAAVATRADAPDIDNFAPPPGAVRRAIERGLEFLGDIETLSPIGDRAGDENPEH
jgi:hypothetical protein